MNTSYQLGVSQAFPCNYLPEQEERLLIAVDERLQTSDKYTWLMHQGFRRSGDQIYRPYCEHCNACQSLRVVTEQFTPTKSQKRLLKKNKHLEVVIKHKLQDYYYPLYEKYINEIHYDGAMYPPSKPQFESFLSSQLCQQLFIELWHDNTLVSVAVTDVLVDGLSAVYTFYHSKYRASGIGNFSILNQVQVAKTYKKPYLYLGYQIDDCQKMNYKNRYFPHQILRNNRWQTINKS
ncbi:arginyltransferase [Thalassotalea sp. 1_MG-2023]|uniref:arginyltransferase n=1 Tax=Thalassotalea sp. 1_MG-2023 TaxID=3062680 RepID=UPI0026E1A97A|nr:arginyltransferase [Thalassotalea sp. 1_MG-2023]MDO6428718.1 arginyltransferase [Thalassotalea sp. 1_MG-2023]